MKTIFFMLFFTGLTMSGFAQRDVDLPKTDRNVDEVVVSPPEFTGVISNTDIKPGDPDLIKWYIAKHVAYPAEAVRCRSEGTEVIQFTVTKAGELTDIQIINHVCPAIDREMIAALKSTDGMWKPGLENGEAADMDYELYLTFSLSASAEEAQKDMFRKMKKHYHTGSELMFKRDNFKRAERVFDSGIRLWPFEPNMLLLRGLCRYEQGKINQAYSDWDRAKELCGLDFNGDYMIEEATEMKGYNELVSLMTK